MHTQSAALDRVDIPDKVDTLEAVLDSPAGVLGKGDIPEEEAGLLGRVDTLEAVPDRVDILEEALDRPHIPEAVCQAEQEGHLLVGLPVEQPLEQVEEIAAYLSLLVPHGFAPGYALVLDTWTPVRFPRDVHFYTTPSFCQSCCCSAGWLCSSSR